MESLNYQNMYENLLSRNTHWKGHAVTAGGGGLVAVLSPRKLNHIGFMVDTQPLQQVLLEYFSFPLSVSFHEC